MLKKHPKLKIFGHSQCFWSEIGKNTEETRGTYPKGKVEGGRLPELLRNYENLYCDLSAGSGSNALTRDREHAARFIEEFSDRILYGCDICAKVNTFPFDFDAFLTSMRESGEISEENYRKIVRENAVKLLSLEGEAKCKKSDLEYLAAELSVTFTPEPLWSLMKQSSSPFAT